MIEPRDIYIEFVVRSRLVRYEERSIRVNLGEGELGLDQDTVNELYDMTDDEIQEYLINKYYDEDIDWPTGYNTDPILASITDKDPDNWDTDQNCIEEIEVLEVDRIEEEEYD